MTIGTFKSNVLGPSNFISKNFLYREMHLLCKNKEALKIGNAARFVTAKTANDSPTQKTSAFLKPLSGLAVNTLHRFEKTEEVLCELIWNYLQNLS